MKLHSINMSIHWFSIAKTNLFQGDMKNAKIISASNQACYMLLCRMGLEKGKKESFSPTSLM